VILVLDPSISLAESPSWWAIMQLDYLVLFFALCLVPWGLSGLKSIIAFEV